MLESELFARTVCCFRESFHCERTLLITHCDICYLVSTAAGMSIVVVAESVHLRLQLQTVYCIDALLLVRPSHLSFLPTIHLQCLSVTLLH